MVVKILSKINTMQFIVLLFFMCLTNFAQSQVPAFRTSQDAYIYYDNNYNVAQRLRDEENRKNNLLSEEEKKPVKVALFEVPMEALGNQLFVSQFLSEYDYQKTFLSQKTILIPVLETQKLVWSIFRAKFGPPKYTTLAQKTLSRATYYIHPIEGVGGFFAKFVSPIPGFDEKIKREILITDYIKTQIDQLPEEMRDLSMDSYMGINFSFLGIKHLVAYRSAKVISDRSTNIRVYPGHGLLGCESCIQDYAIKRTGINDGERAIKKWKQEEFIPKLAKYIAYSHHVLGVSFEAHTQNILIEVDHRTGEIKKFYFRDFSDILLNPIPLLSENRLPEEIDWNKVKLLSVHANYFSDPSVQMAKDIWYHASIYTGQALTSHVSGFSRQRSNVMLFMKAYIQEVEKILGQPIPLSLDAKKVMESLGQKASKEELYSGELQQRSPLRNAMASVLKSVFEFSHQIQIQKIEQELKDSVQSEDISKLRKVFFRALKNQRVIFMGAEERRMLVGPDSKWNWLKITIQAYIRLGLGQFSNSQVIDFKILNGRIWAVDRQTQKPLATTIKSYQEYTQPQTCQQLFRGDL